MVMVSLSWLFISPPPSFLVSQSKHHDTAVTRKSIVYPARTPWLVGALDTAAAAGSPVIHELDLKCNAVGPEGAHALAAALQSVGRLDLAGSTRIIPFLIRHVL